MEGRKEVGKGESKGGREGGREKQVRVMSSEVRTREL